MPRQPRFRSYAHRDLMVKQVDGQQLDGGKKAGGRKVSYHPLQPLLYLAGKMDRKS